MTTRNHRIRFLTNNMAAEATVTASSYQASFPVSNLFHEHRFKRWKPAGNFEITAANKNLYINDGEDKTVSLVEGSYTYATLAAHIETQLNASSSGWTAAYDFDGGTFKFSLANSGSVTLRLSETTNAVWDTLGFLGTENDTGESFVADEQRNHTSEWIKINYGGPQEVTAMCLIGKLAEVFCLSSSAVVTFEANSLDAWSEPPVQVTVTADNLGAFAMFDDLEDTAYQWNRIKIVDRTNPIGPEGFAFGHLYLGDYITITRRNLSSGFQWKYVDPSEVLSSAGGAEWWRKRPKYFSFDGGNILFLDPADGAVIEQMAYDLGKSTPFYISLDPTLQISSSLSKFTRYVRFDPEPTLLHNKAAVWSFTGLSVREVG